MLVDPDAIPGSRSVEVENSYSISYKLEESIACILEDDFEDGSLAEDEEYKNIDITTTPQDSLGAAIKQSGVWSIQKKCSDCCKTLKTKKVVDLNHTASNSLKRSAYVGDPSDSSLNGNDLKKWLSEGGYVGGNVGLQTFMQNLVTVDASLFAKVKECLTEQASKFNKNGYFKGRTDQSTLESSLKDLSQKIDEYLKRKLTCNNSQAACDECISNTSMELDSTYKSENEVELEQNFSSSISKLNPSNYKQALLTLQKNKAWIKN